MPSYLDLAFEGNYAGRVWGAPGWEMYTLNGVLYAANYLTDDVIIY